MWQSKLKQISLMSVLLIPMLTLSSCGDIGVDVPEQNQHGILQLIKTLQNRSAPNILLSAGNQGKVINAALAKEPPIVLVPHKELLQAHRKADKATLDRAFQLLYRGERKGKGTENLTKKQYDLFLCVVGKKQACFDQSIGNFSADELNEPAGFMLKPLNAAAATVAQPAFVERMLQQGADANLIKLSHSGSQPILDRVLDAYLIFTWEHHGRFNLWGTNQDYYPLQYKTKKTGLTSKHKQHRDNLLAIAKLLIDYGADVNLPFLIFDKKRNQYTPHRMLTAAVEYGDMDVVQLLVDSGADIHARLYQDKKHGDAINAAINHDNAELVEYLYQLGAQVHIEKYGRYPPQIARWLYQQGYDPNKYFLLRSAIDYRYTEFLDELLKDPKVEIDSIEYEWEFDGSTKKGTTLPLVTAIIDWNQYAMEQLLKHGANPCIRSISHLDGSQEDNAFDWFKTAEHRKTFLKLVKKWQPEHVVCADKAEKKQ